MDTKAKAQEIYLDTIATMNTFRTPADLMQHGRTGSHTQFGWSGKSHGFGGMDTGQEGQDRGDKIASLIAQTGAFRSMGDSEAHKAAASKLRECGGLDTIWRKVKCPVIRELPIACYSHGGRHSTDGFLMIPPAESFGGTNEIRVVEAHELIHWTGDRARLDRRSARYDVMTDTMGKHNGGVLAHALEEITADAGAYIVLSKIAPDTAAACKSLFATRCAVHLTAVSTIIKALGLVDAVNKHAPPHIVAAMGRPGGTAAIRELAESDWRQDKGEGQRVTGLARFAYQDAAYAADYLLKMAGE